MSQSLILKKLAKFLEVINPASTGELQNELKDHGHCYGFALCYAALKQQNKLEWWEALLYKIATWDEKESSLDQEILLPQAIADPELPPLPPKVEVNLEINVGMEADTTVGIKVESKSPVRVVRKPTLRTHLERVVNYVFYHQAWHELKTPTDSKDTSAIKNFQTKDLNQTSINDPDRLVKDIKDSTKEYKQSHFELTSESKEITHSQDRKYVCRYMSDEYLADLIKRNKKSIQDSICLVISMNHATSLSFDGKKWRFYDPNYSHSDPKKMYKEFDEDKVLELAKEIKRILSNTLGLEFVSLDKPITLDLPEEKQPLEAIKEFGLSKIAWHTPEKIPAILDEAEKTPEGQLEIARGLRVITTSIKNKPGICFILDDAPTHLSRMIDIVFKNLEATIMFAQALFLKNDKGKTYYELISSRTEDFKKIQNNFVKLFPVKEWEHEPAAEKQKLKESIIKLIATGMDVNIPNITGYGTLLLLAAVINDDELIKYLISKGADTRLKNADGKRALELLPTSSPISESSKILKQKMLDQVIETLDVKTISEEAKLFSLDLKSANITKVFNKSGQFSPYDAKKEDQKHVTAIHEVINFLIDQGASLNCADDSGSTLLHMAVKTNDAALFKDLANRPGIPYQQNNNGHTPFLPYINPEFLSFLSPLSLEKAICDQDIDAVKAHLNNENILKACNLGDTYSTLNSQKRDKMVEITKILIEAGVDVNKTNRNGDTALHWAAYWHDPELFCLLCNKGANLQLKNKSNRTAFEEGCNWRGRPHPKIEIMANPEKIEMLSKSVEMITADSKEDLDIKKLFDLFCYDADTVATQDSHKNSILHLAVMTNNPVIVAQVLKQNPKRDALNGLDPGLTPIQAGMNKFGYKLNPIIVTLLDPSLLQVKECVYETAALKESIKKLIAAGMDVNTPNTTKYGTFLHFAAAINDTKFINYLISKGANARLKSIHGKTALELLPASLVTTESSKILKQKMLDQLIETLDVKALSDDTKLFSFDFKSANITKVFYKSGHFNFYDAKKEDPKRITDAHEVIHFLINEGASLNCSDDNGATLLHMAIDTNDLSLFKDLVNRPEIPYLQDCSERTPLDRISSFQKSDFLSFLSLLTLEKAVRDQNIEAIKAHLDQKNILKACNLGVLCFALKHKRREKIVEIIKLLIDAGIDVNKADRKGNTALHWAAYWNNPELFYLLCNNGANLHLKTIKDNTPYKKGIQEHKDRLNPKIVAFGNPEKIEILSKSVEKITVDSKEDKDLNTMFDLFCYDADTVAIQDSHKNTILHLAVMTNNPEIVAKVLKQNPKKDVLNSLGLTSIQAGIQKFGDKLNPKVASLIQLDSEPEKSLTQLVIKTDSPVFKTPDPAFSSSQAQAIALTA